ncbi:hypothetical protein C8Q80DRAFT_1123405 [Daedaleopsis nitida]|nr:hypothetical protein C8Q80DRAFT_1123405 [Daedaleopsis nitida]
MVLNLARTEIGNLTVYGLNGLNKQLMLTEPEMRCTVCMSTVVMGHCKFVEPATFMMTRMIKQILGYPLRGEWERSLSTLGTVLREYKLTVPTYRDQNSKMPRAGVVFRTHPEEEAKSHKVFGLEATLTKRLAKAVGGGPAAGLRAMADKVLWSVDDDIPVWDARALYKKNHLVANKGGIKWGDIQNLDRLDTDIPYGAIAVVFYIPSTFTRPANISNSRNAFPASARNTMTSVNLSLNLCGAALIADKPDDD